MQEVRYNHQPGNIPAAVADFPLFSRLDKNCLDEVLSNSSIVRLDAGEKFLEEGGKASGLYVLLRGKFQVSKNGRQVATVENPGDLIGEMAFALDQPHQATVTAINNASALKIDSKVMDSLPGKHSDHFQHVIYRYLTELLAKRLAKTSELLAGTSGGEVYYL